MNERIKELAKQAGAYWDHGDWNMPSSVYFSERDLEKFAELIVRECAQFIFVLDAEPVSHKSAARLLQEHFGIE